MIVNKYRQIQFFIYFIKQNLMKNQLETQETDHRRKQQKPKKIQQTSSQNQSLSLDRESRPAELQINPQYIFQFIIPTSDILDMFEEMAEVLNFQMVEKQVFYATAVKKQKKKGLFQMLNCLSWWGSFSNVTAIKISIMNNGRNLKKVCCLKGLVGSMQEMNKFIQEFKKKLGTTSASLPSNPIIMETQPYEDYEFKEQNSNPFHLEACSDFMLHKILSSNKPEEFAISTHLKKLLNDYFSSFKNVQESVQLLPSPMKNAITITQDISGQIGKFITSRSESNTEAILPFFKISVEKYVFDKVEHLLKKIYQHKTKSVNQTFHEKRKMITQTNTIQQIFEEVLLNKDLRICKKAKEIPTQDFFSHRNNIPFCSIACVELQKISSISNPRQKIKHCQIMYASLKSYFYDKLNKKYELSSMQDIIPVFITVILFTKVENLRLELSMMLDFINEYGEECEGEKRSIINLSQSFNYIVRDWKV